MVTLAETLDRAASPEEPVRPVSRPAPSLIREPQAVGGHNGAPAYDPQEPRWEPVEAFLTARGAARRSSVNTLSAYRNDLRQLRRYLDGRAIEGWVVEPVVVLEFVAWLKDQEFAPASQARKLAATRAFYTFMHESGRMGTN